MLTPVSYNSEFYKELRHTSSKSAIVLAEFILREFKPKSVVDFGCGTGELLKALELMGEVDCLGIEGPWIKQASKCYHRIVVKDLREVVALEKTYDVAVCLEVGEHLEGLYSRNLIATLTNSADIIVFSAAIPGQNGTEHINLQFPEYWAKLFWERGFSLWLDPRSKFYENYDLAAWYQQNTLVYKKIDHEVATKDFISPNLVRHPLIFPKKYPIKNIVYRAKARIHGIIRKGDFLD